LLLYFYNNLKIHLNMRKIYSSKLVMVLMLQAFVAANAFGQAANLDQYRNGSAASPVVTGANWVNGNLGSSNSHYVEGMSSSYRCVMTGLPTGTPITITFGYDVKHSDRMAVDYLTYYHRLEPHAPFGHPAEPIDPTAGTALSSAVFTTFPIPTPPVNMLIGFNLQPQASYNALPAAERVMTLFNGTISGINYVAPLADLNAAQSEQRISITFTSNGPTAILAWGGHIGSRLDWGYDINGVPLSAGGISGSPYHMRLLDWTLNNLGNQDRSLSADAVVSPPTCNVAVTPLSQAVCEGDNFSISLTTSGGTSPYTYVWTGPNGYYDSTTTNSLSHVITINNAQLANAGVYSLMITDGAAQTCAATANIAVNAVPVCSITHIANNFCPGSSNIYFAPAGYGYSWSVQGSGSISGAANTQTVTVISGNSCNSSYTLSLTLDANGCTSTCSQTWMNEDNVPPVLTVPASYTISGDTSNAPCVDLGGGGVSTVFNPNPFGQRSPVRTDYAQARNANHPTNPINWTGGINNMAQSEYFEGMGVPQRIIFTGLDPDPQTGNTHSLIFRHEAVKHQSGDRHAYDFLMSWEQAVATAALVGNSATNELQDLIAQTCYSGIGANALAACNGFSSFAFANVPDLMGNPPNHHGISNVDNAISCFESLYGNRTIELKGNAPISGFTLTFMGYSGSSTGDNYAWYTATWTSASDEVMLMVAGHAAVGFGPCGYGSCYGAGRISGGPYHFKLDLLDGKSLGNRDNQVMVSELDCDLNVPISFGTPTATDNCSANPVINVVSTTVVSNSANSITHCRTWSATDDCNNQSTGTQCITVECPPPLAPSSGERSMQAEEVDGVIFQAYPNPFTSNVTIEFSSDISSYSTVEVYTLTGEKVATVFNQDTEAGNTYHANFNAKGLADGIYIYRITTGSQVINGKLTLMK
jgi:hypothetical protein